MDWKYVKKNIIRLINFDFIILFFIPIIILFNIIMGIYCINLVKVQEDILGILSGIFFVFMYVIYKCYIEKKNKILSYKELDKGEIILNNITINGIFGYIFIFICGLVTSRATLLAIGYTYNNMGHLNNDFAPYLLVMLIVFTPIPVFFFTNANVYITNKRICIIWNDFFIKSLFRVKNSNYVHNNICAIKKTGLIFKKITIKYNGGNKYEISSIVVKNYKEIKTVLNGIMKNIGDKK